MARQQAKIAYYKAQAAKRQLDSLRARADHNIRAVIRNDWDDVKSPFKVRNGNLNHGSTEWNAL